MNDILLQLRPQMIETLSLLILCSLFYILYKLYTLKIKNKRRKARGTKRVKLILLTIILLFAFQIWVPGFFGIFAIMGFLSGAIVLTQKDNFMNLAGWVIISWRELFVEGDLIKVSNYMGMVKSVGFLYFTLQEVDSAKSQDLSGNIIRVPNGIVSKQPIVNYTIRRNHKHQLEFVFKGTTDLQELDNCLGYLHTYLKEDLVTKKYDTKLIKKINLKFRYFIKQDNPAGIQVKVTIFSPLQCMEDAEQSIEKYLINVSQKSENLNLLS